ncbi:MAG: glycosyl transferase family 9 [Ectothiorhodospiraceae bacterium]|nr:glycosyl transferase family 9 [Ectothiorhodospiraceae bacterium]
MFEDVQYKSDCRFFRGDIPCKPHKLEGVHCRDCPHYKPTDRNILIIKLGAIGDVIRTTPLLQKLRSLYPNARIWWLTLTPEILPEDVDVKLAFDVKSAMTILAINFDLLINLDKDREACALTDRIDASVKKGFYLQNGVCAPLNDDARDKFMTGIFDDINKANTKHYVQEIFEICGYEWKGEDYVLEFVPEEFGVPHDTPVIGLNTGCGGRWTSRLWDEKYWIQLIALIREAGYHPLLLGGPQEDEKNKSLAAETGAQYLGYFPLQRFFALMDHCDVVVTGVTMAMHIAIGLKKNMILFNNIFNRHEFELYGRGEILEPSKECQCFFLATCKNDEYQCMEHLEPERVFDAVKRWVPEQAAVSS